MLIWQHEKMAKSCKLLQLLPKKEEGEYVTRSKTSNVISIEMFMDTSICNTILIAVERWQQLGCPGNTALRT